MYIAMFKENEEQKHLIWSNYSKFCKINEDQTKISLISTSFNF